MLLNKFALPGLGAVLALTGAALLLGLDKLVEASLVNVLPTRLREFLTLIRRSGRPKTAPATIFSRRWCKKRDQRYTI